MKKKILGVVFFSTVILSQHVAAQDDIPTPVVQMRLESPLQVKFSLLV